MYYGTTQTATDFAVTDDSWFRRTINCLLFFIPRANPDIESLLPQVKTWALELSDDGWPEREIGISSSGEVLFRLPDDRNTGFWTDMARKQFMASELKPLSRKEFDELWSKLTPNPSFQRTACGGR